MLEALKLATTLPCVLSPEYKAWPTPRHTALTLAAKHGYAAVGMRGEAGELREGSKARLAARTHSAWPRGCSPPLSEPAFARVAFGAGAVAADVTLWDLGSLALLPRTDPLSLLVLGSRSQAPSAGSALHSCWVAGRRIVAEGEPCGVDLHALRTLLRDAQPTYRDPEITDPTTDPATRASEVEYRAAMGLDAEGQTGPTPPELRDFPKHRVLYDATLP